MEELQAGVKFALTVLPQASALVDPCERALDHPTLWHDGKGMHLAALGDLYLCSDQLFDRLSERLPDITTIGQDTLNRLQIGRAAAQRQQGALAVGHIGCGDGNRMWQSLGIDGDVSLDSGHFLPRVVPLVACAIGVLDALRVDDQEARRALAPLFCTSRANHIFLKPAPAC